MQLMSMLLIILNTTGSTYVEFTTVKLQQNIIKTKPVCLHISSLAYSYMSNYNICILNRTSPWNICFTYINSYVFFFWTMKHYFTYLSPSCRTRRIACFYLYCSLNLFFPKVDAFHLILLRIFEINQRSLCPHGTCSILQTRGCMSLRVWSAMSS